MTHVTCVNVKSSAKLPGLGRDLLEVGLFLGEDSHTEVSVLVRFEGGRDDQVLAGRETEPAADFSQVDERF